MQWLATGECKSSERGKEEVKARREKSISHSVTKCLPLKWKPRAKPTRNIFPEWIFRFHAPHPLIDFLATLRQIFSSTFIKISVKLMETRTSNHAYSKHFVRFNPRWIFNENVSTWSFNADETNFNSFCGAIRLCCIRVRFKREFMQMLTSFSWL